MPTHTDRRRDVARENKLTQAINTAVEEFFVHDLSTTVRPTIPSDAIDLFCPATPFQDQANAAWATLRRMRNVGREEEALSLADVNISEFASIHDLQDHVAIHHVEPFLISGEQNSKEKANFNTEQRIESEVT